MIKIWLKNILTMLVDKITFNFSRPNNKKIIIPRDIRIEISRVRNPTIIAIKILKSYYLTNKGNIFTKNWIKYVDPRFAFLT